jgi:hypothetical protein
MSTAPFSLPFERLLGALILGLAIGLVPASASSQPLDPRSLGSKELVDPLDGHSFLHEYPLATNGLGGYDSDGCTYARGLQPRTFGIATSPTTLFSAPPDLWPDSIPADKKEELWRTLVAIGKEVTDVRKLEASEKYELAALAASQLGASHFRIGELYLQGAWTVRDSIVGFLPGVQGAADAWKKLAELIPLAQKQTDPVPRTRAIFDLARLSHRGGFWVERDDFLALLDTFEDAGIGGKEKRRQLLGRVGEENRLLSKARDRFRQGLNIQEGTPEERAYYRYLVGDLSRRLGDFDEARTELEASDLAAATPEEVRAYAKDVLQVIKLQARPEAKDGG